MTSVSTHVHGFLIEKASFGKKRRGSCQKIDTNILCVFLVQSNEELNDVFLMKHDFIKRK